MYFMSDPQALHVTRNVIPGKLGVDLHLHRVHIPLVLEVFIWTNFFLLGSILCLAVPPIMLHNLSLRAILYDAVLHLGNINLID